MALFQRTVQKMVLVVRTDLNMSQGKIASQCAHAALDCYLKSRSGLSKIIASKTWIMLGQPKVVLKVNSEEELLEIANTAHKAGLIVSAVRDAGKTQVKAGTVTVVGIGPGFVDRVDSITQHLKLL